MGLGSLVRLSLVAALAIPSAAHAQVFDGFRRLRPLPLPTADMPARCGALGDPAPGEPQPILGGRWRARLPAAMGPRPGPMPGSSTPWPGLWLREGDAELWLQVTEEAVRPDASFERFLDERRAALPPPSDAAVGTISLARGRAVVVLPDAPWRDARHPPVAWGYLLSHDGLAQWFSFSVPRSMFEAHRDGCRALVLRALATFVDGDRSPIVRGATDLTLENGRLHVVLPSGEFVPGESLVDPIGRTVFLRRVAARSHGQLRGPAIAISRSMPGRWSPSTRARRRRGRLFTEAVEWIEEVVDFGAVRDARARATVTLGGVAYDVVVAAPTPRERSVLVRAFAEGRFEPSPP